MCDSSCAQAQANHVWAPTVHVLRAAGSHRDQTCSSAHAAACVHAAALICCFVHHTPVCGALTALTVPAACLAPLRPPHTCYKQQVRVSSSDMLLCRTSKQTAVLLLNTSDIRLTASCCNTICERRSSSTADCSRLCLPQELLQAAGTHVIGSFSPSISLRVSNFDPTRIGSRPLPILTADLVPAGAYAHDSFSSWWLTAWPTRLQRLLRLTCNAEDIILLCAAATGIQRDSATARSAYCHPCSPGGCVSTLLTPVKVHYTITNMSYYSCKTSPG